MWNSKQSKQERQYTENELTPGQVIKPIDNSSTEPVKASQQEVNTLLNSSNNNSQMLRPVRLIIALTILLGLGIISLFIYMKMQNNNVPSNNAKTEKTEITDKVVASNIDEFGLVCSGQTISNADAANNRTQAKIVIFENTLKETQTYSRPVLGSSNEEWLASGTSFRSVVYVGCLRHIKEKRSDILCKIKTPDSEQVKTINMYNVQYAYSVVEAKSGKILGTENIESIATSCPEQASFTRNDLKIFSTPDLNRLKEISNKYYNIQ
jgi:hypothetical protein